MEDPHLRSATLGYSLALCRAIAACRQLEQLLNLLTQGVASLLDCGLLDTGGDAPDEEVGACRRSLVAAAAAAADQSEHSPGWLVQHAFYCSSAFQEVSQVLLTGEAGTMHAHGAAIKHGAASPTAG